MRAALEGLKVGAGLGARTPLAPAVSWQALQHISCEPLTATCPRPSPPLKSRSTLNVHDFAGGGGDDNGDDASASPARARATSAASTCTAAVVVEVEVECAMVTRETLLWQRWKREGRRG